MKTYFFKRIIQLMVVMFAASFFTFVMTYMAPGDPAEMLLKAHDTIPTEEALEAMRADMGLNQPFLVQYGNWLKGVLKGDLGESYSTGEPVFEKAIPRLGMTVKLAVVAFALLVVISFIFGLLSAVHKGKIADYLIRFLSFGAISIPSFWLGLILIYVFVVRLQWFRITEQDTLKSVILPALTLSIPLMGRYIRIIRTAVLDEYSKDYVAGERARGAGEMSILIRNVLPNSVLSILTLLGLSAALLLGGTVIVENIFSWQGLGAMALQAITYRDYPVLQAYVLFMSVIYVGVNFLVDIVSQLLDPRLREEI